MNDCCGKARATAFCADCGAQLMADGRTGLLLHLKNRVSSVETDLARFERNIGKSPSLINVQWIAKKKALVVKWQSWLDAFTEMLDEQASSRKKP